MGPPDNWQPAVTFNRLQARARLLRDIREFFSANAVLEVETPLMSMAGNTDPEIQSIRTDNGSYLRTSPEFALKRLLAAGSGDIFELGRVFRAGESGRSHNPEFTMLEWYRTGISYHRLMDEVTSLVKQCGRGKFDHWAVRMISYRQLFLEYIGTDPYTANKADLMAIAEQNGLTEIELNHKQWLDLLLSVVIQPVLPETSLTFVYDFPIEQKALARVRKDNPPVAERFELYLGQIELANGYQELTDAAEQKQRFDEENQLRSERELKTCPIDHHLISALEHGLPECAGVALGVDRLLMAITGDNSINEVTAFPFSRA